MKRFIVVFLAAVMVLGISTAYAASSSGPYAAPSIDGNGTKIPGTNIVIGDNGQKMGIGSASTAPGNIIPSNPVKAQAEVETIRNVADMITGMINSGIVPAINIEVLTAVINAINDPAVEPLSVADVVSKLDIDNQYKVYGKDGIEKAKAQIDLEDYEFISVFEKLNIKAPQTIGPRGNLFPANITLAPQCLADVDSKDMGNYMMIVYNPENGEVAFMELDAESFDASKNPPELSVTVPFDGLFAFVEKIEN